MNSAQGQQGSNRFLKRLSEFGVLAPDWTVVQHDVWISASPVGHVPLGQGWKLHVSATLPNAEEVLARVIPVLLAHAAAFKVAASHDVLVSLNEGREGLSQVGKFLTVYPVDDTQAVTLAAELDRATRGLVGPPVPSDRRLNPGSLVYYRYGGFESRTIQLPYGEIVPAIVGPDGTLVPDKRETVFAAPDWVKDPFQPNAAARDAAEAETLVIAGRFVLAASLHHTPRGRVFLALDLEAGRRSVVKQAPAGASASMDGRDARDQLRNEHEVLSLMAGDNRFPQVYGFVEQGDAAYLALSDLAGRTLGEVIAALRKEGRFLPLEQLVQWSVKLASAVGALHARNLVHRDLKPTNVIVSDAGIVTVIDLELAARIGDTRPALGLGTPGYMSPQQQAGKPPSPTDDVFGLGAILYFMATGAEPGQTPRADALTDRPPVMLRPDLPADLVSILERCLDRDPARRFQDASRLVTALSEASLLSPKGPVEPARAFDPADLARRTALSLAGSETWMSRRYAARGVMANDINVGIGGIVLALADLGDLGGDPVRGAVMEGAQRLVRSLREGDGGLPGLFVGRSGIAAALLRAGQCLGEGQLVEAALELGRRVARQPYASPDLFNGTAGRLLAHLLLWDESHARDQLEAAVACGGALLASATPAGKDELCWAIPEGYGGLSGKAHTGYSHGAAGIGDVLLDLYHATGDERYAASALSAARWLTRVAVPATDDADGLEWPVVEGSECVGPLWCHGSAGVARFFLHLAKTGLLPEAASMARKAIKTLIRGGRSLGPTRCHGLAGGIELLLDASTQFGDHTLENQAWSFARLLPAFSDTSAGALRWCSDDANSIEPGYMVGGAGIAIALARLTDASRPHQLSRAGFRWKPASQSARSITASRSGGS